MTFLGSQNSSRCKWVKCDDTENIFRCSKCGRDPLQITVFPLEMECPGVRPLCKNLQEELDLIHCIPCGNFKIKTFGCLVHKKTTVSQKLPGIKCCLGCLEYTP